MAFESLYPGLVRGPPGIMQPSSWWGEEMFSGIAQVVGNEDGGESAPTATDHHYPCGRDPNATVEQRPTFVDSDNHSTDETTPGDTDNIGGPAKHVHYHFYHIRGDLSSVNISGNRVCNNSAPILSGMEIKTGQKSQKDVHEERDHCQSFPIPSSSNATNVDETPPNSAVSLVRRNGIRRQKQVSLTHTCESDAPLIEAGSEFRYARVRLSDPGPTSHEPAPQDLADVEEKDCTEPQQSSEVERSSFRREHRASTISYVTDRSPDTQVSVTPDDAHHDASLQTTCSNDQFKEDSSSFSVRGSSPHLSRPKPSHRSCSLSPSPSPRTYPSSRSSSVYLTSSSSSHSLLPSPSLRAYPSSYYTSSPSFRTDTFPTHEPPLSVPGAKYPTYEFANQPTSPTYTEPVHYPQPTAPTVPRAMTFPAPTFISTLSHTISPTILIDLPIPEIPSNVSISPVSYDNHQKLTFPDQTTYGFPMPTSPSIGPSINLPSPKLYQEPTPRFYQEPDHDPVLVSDTGEHGQGGPSSTWYDAVRGDIQWNPFMGAGGGSHYNRRNSTSWP